MADFTDFASAIGIPAGGVAAAVMIYSGCVVAEEEARKEALAAISAKVFSSEFSASKSASFIKSIFYYTFGGRHLSLRCAIASFCATLSFILIIGFQYSLLTGVRPDFRSAEDLFAVTCILLVAALLDYVSLYKSRKLIELSVFGKISPIKTVIFDVSATIVLTLCTLICLGILFEGLNFISKAPIEIKKFIEGDVIPVITHNNTRPGFPLVGVVTLSTYVIPLWATILIVSTSVFEYMRPLQKAVAWFFPVEEHPIRAIGIVAAGLILITSFAWALIRPLFA